MNMAFAFFITSILVMITTYIFFEKWKPTHLLLSRIQNYTVLVSTSVTASQFLRQQLARYGDDSVLEVTFPEASSAFPNQVPRTLLTRFSKEAVRHFNTRMDANSFAAEDWSSRIEELLDDISNAQSGRTEFFWLRTLQPTIKDARGWAIQFIYVQYTDRYTESVDEEVEKVWVAYIGGGWLPHDSQPASFDQLVDALNGETVAKPLSSETLANLRTGLHTAQMVDGVLVMKPTIELGDKNSQQTPAIELARDEECMICRQSYEDGEALRLLDCGHVFHQVGIDEVRNPV
jgi:hypothetical protein